VRGLDRPTLLTPIDAGQLRINMPAARVLELYVRATPTGRGRPCVLVWTEESGKQPWLGLLEQAAARLR
jgi:hypothetical protein